MLFPHNFLVRKFGANLTPKTHRCVPRLLAFTGLILIGSGQSLAQTEPPVITSVEIVEDDKLAIDLLGKESQYYRLVEVDLEFPIEKILQFGLAAENSPLRFIAEPTGSGSFFRIQAIDLQDPLDADRDGLDDLFELENPDFFNPLDARDAFLDFDLDGVLNREESRAGTSLFEADIFPPRIASTSPTNGEDQVNVSRKLIIYFDKPIDPCVMEFDPFTPTISGEAIEGEWRLSSTREFATFFANGDFPPSTEVVVIVDSDKATGEDCAGFDGNGNFVNGGKSEFAFRTLSVERMTGTQVFGFVRDSFSGEPIEGVTISLDHVSLQSTTDAEGRFELISTPAPEFFVHIIGATAVNAPEGMAYPTIGKIFRSVAGQTTQISLEGEPFDIYLPPLVDTDYQTLNGDASTAIGLGAGALANAVDDFPEISPEEWGRFRLDLPPNSATNQEGILSDRATVIPVPPERIPEPLPSFLNLSLVVSIQIPGATFLDVPAPVTFPNTDNLPPGSKTNILSFDHDSGAWIVIGTATVSEDGLLIQSDPGVGILAPGWHGVQPGTQLTTSEDPGTEEDLNQPDCEPLKALQELKDSLSTQFDCIIDIIPLRKSLQLAGAGASTANKWLDGFLQIKKDTSIDAAQGVVTTLGGLKNFTKKAAELIDSPEPNATDLLGENPAEKFRKIVECVLATAKENLELACAGANCLPGLVSSQTLQGVACDDGIQTLDSLTREIKVIEALTNGKIALDGICLFMDEISAYNTDPQQSLSTNPTVLNTITPQSIPDPLWELLQDGLAELEYAVGHFEGHVMMDEAMGELLESQRIWIEEVLSPLLYHSNGYQNCPFVIESGGFTYRSESSSSGGINGLPLIGANAPYAFEIYDPVLGLVARYEGISADSGDLTHIGTPILKLPGLTDLSGDEDGDGLTAAAEAIIGTRDDNPDTDGDGLEDGFEIRNGGDPLSGLAVSVGILSRLDLPSDAWDVITHGDRAYLLGEDASLYIVDIANPQAPVLIDTLQLEGQAHENGGLEIAPELNILVVATEEILDLDYLSFFDITDPDSPFLFNTLRYESQMIDASPKSGLMLSSGVSEIALIDVASGNILDRLSTNTVEGFTTTDTHAYVAISREIRVFDISENRFLEITGTPAPTPTFGAPIHGSQMLIDGDWLLLGTFEGLATYNITDRANPQLVGEPSSTQLAVHFLESDASGNILMNSSNGGRPSLRFSIYDLKDLSNVEQLQLTIDTPGYAYALDVKEGLAYIADDSAGLSILNYYAFANNNEAVPLELDLSYLDEDPTKDGIQIISDNQAFLEVRARRNYNAPIAQASLEIDGAEVERLVKGPLVFNIPVPVVDPESDSRLASLVYRETRLDGSSLVSDPVELDILPPTKAPTITFASPDQKVLYASRPLLFRFDRELDDLSFDPGKISLLNYGADRQLGGNDDSTVPFNSFRLSGQSLALFADGAYPEGRYQLTIEPNAYGDSHGNRLEQSIVYEFEIFDLPETVLIFTGGGETADFGDPGNWNQNIGPTGENVFIPDYGEPVTISTRTSTVTDFTAAGDLNIIGTLRVNGRFSVQGATTITDPRGTLILAGPDPVFQSDVEVISASLQSSYPLAIGGNFTLSNSSLLQLSGEGTTVEVTGVTTFENSSVSVNQGAIFELPELVDYVSESTSAFAGNSSFRARGEGSRISLPNLKSITGPTGGLRNVTIQAWQGGHVELPVLDTTAGRVRFEIYNEGSRLDLPILTEIVGPEGNAFASVDLQGTGLNFNAPLLTNLSNCDLRARDEAPFPWSQLTSFGPGHLEFRSTSPDLSNLATMTEASLTAIGGSVVELPGFSEFSYTTGKTWLSRDPGSRISLPSLTSLSGPEPGAGIAFLKLETSTEGQIDLPNLTSLSGGIFLSSREANTVFELSALTTMTSPNGYASKIESRNGASIVLSEPSLENVEVNLFNSGSVNASTLTFDAASTIQGQGAITGDMTLPGLIILANADNPLAINGNLTLSTTSTVRTSIGLGEDKKQAGKLVVSGSLALDGTLDLRRAFGWTPELGDVAEFISNPAASISGAFTATEGLTAHPTFDLVIQQSSDSVALQVIAKP